VFALALATLFAAAVGWLSVRTEGIYTIMITLAVGVAFFYLAQQNYTLFNGFQGFSKIAPPTVLDVDLHEPLPFYLLALACAAAGYFLSSTWCGPPSVLRCKAFATTRAACSRWATT
jgi:branched-chain amino acid transport system permease protein